MDTSATDMSGNAMGGRDEGDAVSASSESVSPKGVHNLMDVLFPANPPVPRNARVVRLFDLEAAAHDVPSPTVQPAPAQPDVQGAPEQPAPQCVQAPKEPSRRSALRAEKRSSLAASAGLYS